MQDDSQAFHAQWKALPQSIALSFAASKCRQNRQIPHMAGYPAYVNTGTLNTQAPFSSIAFFFSLCLGLCSPTEFYKSGIQSKSILKVHSGPKRSEQAIDLPLGLSKRVPFLNVPFQQDHKGEKARRTNRAPFLFAMMVLQIHGFQVHAGWAGSLVLPCCCFCGLFFLSGDGQRREYSLLVQRVSAQESLSPNYPFCRESIMIPSSACRAVPSLALGRSLRSTDRVLGLGDPQAGFQADIPMAGACVTQQRVKGNAKPQHHGLCLYIFLI